METSVSTFNSLDGATMKADDVFAPTLFAEHFLALGFGVKVGNEADKRVKFREVNHIRCVCLYTITSNMQNVTF